MIVLGLDSSAKTAGVAVLQDADLLYESWLATGFTHSETLLELVDGALRACRLKPADVDVYALTAGPGSFTGLRIGMALVKGFAAVGNVPCVPVSTVEALAAETGMPGLVVPAMDARRGEVYTAAFWRDEQGGLTRLTQDAPLKAPAALQAAFAALPADAPEQFALVLPGDGAHLCSAALQELAPEKRSRVRYVHTSPDRGRRSAVAAARIGLQQALAGSCVSAGELRPDYHRLCQAERERAEREAAARKNEM